MANPQVSTNDAQPPLHKRTHPGQGGKAAPDTNTLQGGAATLSRQPVSRAVGRPLQYKEVTTLHSFAECESMFAVKATLTFGCTWAKTMAMISEPKAERCKCVRNGVVVLLN